MHYFTWILDASFFLSLKGEGGVSASYILPKEQVSGVSVSELAGAETWIVLRSQRGDVSFACIHISKVEEFEEGLNNGDYLLAVDQSTSFRIISNLYDTQGQYSNILSSCIMGVSKIEKEIALSVRKEVLARVATNLRNPPSVLLDKLAAPPEKGTIMLKAKRLIANVSSRLSLEEIWAQRPPISLPPFAYFAYSKVLQAQGRTSADALTKSLSLCDPTAFLPPINRQTSEKSSVSNVSDALLPLVDVDLVLIDIEKIYARKFIAREKIPTDMNEMLGKLENAEKMHQDMLREMVKYLKFLKYTPMQSGSIDLSIQADAGIVLFEIKSAHLGNVFAQVAKGMFQLICYKDALINDGQNVGKSILILQSIGNETVESYIKRIVAYNTIEVLFYTEHLDWPQKVKGLLQSIS